MKRENNSEEVKNENCKPLSESTLYPEHIELVKTTEQSRSQDA